MTLCRPYHVHVANADPNASCIVDGVTTRPKWLSIHLTLLSDQTRILASPHFLDVSPVLCRLQSPCVLHNHNYAFFHRI
jgi:hypothetical protein